MGPLAMIMANIVISLVITALAVRMMSPEGMKAAGLDDFTFPTVDADRAIPVIIGDVLVDGPNVSWFGDYAADADEEGGGLLSPEVIVGYQYQIGMELSISWGEVDSISEIWFGDNVVWEGSQDGQDKPDVWQVDARDAFGGNKNGGGVGAMVGFYPGSPDQSADPYMEAQVGDGFAHKGVCKLIWYGPSYEGNTNTRQLNGYVGESTFIPPMKFRIQHYPSLLGSGKSLVTDPDGHPGANPAEVVYFLMTGRYANVNSYEAVVPVIPEDLIDKPSMLAAADIFHTEGKAISFQWQRDTSVEQIISDIMYHVDGYLVEDVRTGKIKIVLNRADYDVGTLPEFDEDNIVDFSSYSRVNPTAAVNRIGARFTDPDQAFKQIPVNVEDLGNVFEQDMGAPGDIDLHMYHSPTVAIDRATKELVQMSEGIISGTFEANRDANGLNIGDPIKLSWAAFGVTDLVVRVVEKQTGNLENRSIKVQFIQDVFGIGEVTHGSPSSTTWVDIYNDPVDITDYVFLETPNFISQYETGSNDYGLFMLAVFPTVDTANYQPHISLNDAPYYSVGPASPEVPNTILAADYGIEEGPGYDTTTGVRVVGNPPEQWLVAVDQSTIFSFFEHWIMVNDELLAFETSTDNGDGSWTLNNVYRALADTVPANHLQGDRVYFLTSKFRRFDALYTVGDEIDLKTLTRTGKGALSEGAAGVKQHTIVGRKDLPLPPENIQINSEYYPDSIEGVLTVTWNNRDKDTLSHVAWDSATDQTQAGYEVKLRIYGNGGAFLREETGLTGGTYTYASVDELADGGLAQTEMRVEVYGGDGVNDSLFYFDFAFDKQVGGSPQMMEFDLNEAAASSAADVNVDLNEVV